MSSIRQSIPTSDISGKAPIGIPATSLDNKVNTHFSFSKFKCQCIRTKEFSNLYGHITESMTYFSKLIEKLSEFSKMAPSELKNAGKSTRCHPIKNKAKELLYVLLKELGFSQPFLDQQEFFELTLGTSFGRFFGYFVENCFYIVLFDPHHLLYKDLKFYCKNDIMIKSYDPWNKNLQHNIL